MAESEDAGDWFRREAGRRLQQLDAMDQIDQLQRAASAFAARTGRQASGWAELSQAGYLRGDLIDPTGVPYRIDAGVVGLDRQSRLNPLPTAGDKIELPR